MANNSLETDSAQSDTLSQPETSLSYDPTLATSQTAQSLSQSEEVIVEQKKSLKTVARIIALTIIGLLLVGGLIYVFTTRHATTTVLQANDFGELRIGLQGIPVKDSLDTAQSLRVNGRLDVSNSVRLTPSGQPSNPTAGQLYFDKSLNQLLFYNGSQFVTLQGSSTFITNNGGAVANNSSTTNIFNSGGSSISLNGTAGNLALFTGTGSLGNSLIDQSGTTLNVGTSSSAVTLGSESGASSTRIQGGTGNLQLATGDTTGASGSISITTGNSSTTASGNITIDSGSGIIDGKVVSDKTFEGGLDNMDPWFGSTIAQSSAQAHSGVYSLGMTATSPFWGVIERLPGTTVTAGHQYYFSAWVRAATTPRSIIGRAVWVGASGTVTLTNITDSATGWTEMTALATAPAGATSVSFEFQSTGVVSEVHYFDDITVTDLSSASAFSAISIGSTNAKVVTIGNINQIGATSIYGGSGINLTSGAGPINLNGGVVSLTGNAASSINTTSGALTLTSAAAATWGVGTAGSGVGGDLTLRAGNGGAETNNDGGDLFLQGGKSNGTGVPGGVIVKPQTDASDAFQIQNSTGTPLLTADSSAMKIMIAGTSSTFATLALDNAHFSSTQTTAPLISTPTNCGTTPTATVTAASTDVAGSFTITTGTGGTAASCDVTVTFNKAYATAPKSILVVGKTDAASAARQVYVSSATATTFTTSFATSAAGANSTPYSFSYWVIE